MMQNQLEEYILILRKLIEAKKSKLFSQAQLYYMYISTIFWLFLAHLNQSPLSVGVVVLFLNILHFCDFLQNHWVNFNQT